eukprot:CAMPEP_0179480864 /NCGR_PEP_ID=MMETSP0799-20121207/58730_1 /TAXON_ID=46947 /ORGANISM="Geminigera cryophila, Strain CCMP2564" /LENGTH=34 /DNA_ID= /DNA_START= /DNA_END= /DNA_ORIENTATION=
MTGCGCEPQVPALQRAATQEARRVDTAWKAWHRG